MKVFSYSLVIFVFALTRISNAFYCCHYQNQAMNSMKGISCTNEYCQTPEGWEPWTGKKNQFVVDCKYCGNFGNGTIEWTKIIPESQKQENAPNILQKNSENPRPLDNYNCCLYSKPEYYYTKPIMTECPNIYSPNGGMCDSTLYGVPKIGQWYVGELYNECFFLTAVVSD